MPPRTCAKGSRSCCGPATSFEMTNCLGSCALLCTATGRYAEAATVWAALDVHAREHGSTGTSPEEARREEEALAKTRQALGPARVRAAEERGAAMSLDTAAEYSLMLTGPAAPPLAAAGPGAGRAQRPGTGAGHPGRPGPHQRADRRAAVHQRPHGRLAPGPDPGQDRLPPPRRPDPPGPGRRLGLTPAALRNPATMPVGHLTPGCLSGARGVGRPLPGACPGARTCPKRAARTGQIRADRT
jgi:hypothetical protein